MTNEVYDEQGNTVPRADVPTYTPNVVVKNPDIRKVSNIILTGAGIALGTAIVFDASTEVVDWTAYIVPAAAVYGYLSGIFGGAVTIPNIPNKR